MNDTELFDLTMSCLSPEQRKHVEESHINNTDSSRAFLMGFEHGANEAARMSAERDSKCRHETIMALVQEAKEQFGHGSPYILWSWLEEHLPEEDRSGGADAAENWNQARQT